jgi:hypothetical protein
MLEVKVERKENYSEMQKVWPVRRSVEAVGKVVVLQIVLLGAAISFSRSSDVREKEIIRKPQLDNNNDYNNNPF